MARIMTPTATRNQAPSHSPPDMRYTPGIGLARFLGCFSIGLGVAEIIAPRSIARLTGIRSLALIQCFGLREIASGIGILYSPQPAGWVWGRVVGDVMDLGALGAAFADRDGDTVEGARAAALAVAGVTLLDVLAAAELSAAASLEG